MISEKRAFLAMFYYLDAEYDRTKSDDLGNICGEIRLLDDGRPADLGTWQDWQKAVQKALEMEIPGEDV